MAASVFGFLRSVLLTEADVPTDAPAEKARLAERRTFAMKFQQYSAPVQAKGVEDTACYRHNVLISLNEVGGNPGRFGRSVEEFHAGNHARRESWPSEMTSTATHDTKRGEDARARINAISEMPALWQRSLSAWTRANVSRRTAVDREPAPDRNDEYLFYQALLGAWPAEPVDAPIPCEAPPALVRRMRDYMQKVIKESKSHTSWVNENAAYQDAVSTFVETTLAGPGARSFLSSFVPFQRHVAMHGMVNSLAQLVLKIASPGVADWYQGAECWDLHLVDPDNRGRVDFASRQKMLDELLPWIERAEGGKETCPECRDRGPTPLAGFVDGLLASWHDARLKLFVTACGIRLRGRHPEVFMRGSYTPLAANGIGADHLIGFARSFESRALIALVPRLTSALSSSDRLAPIGDEVWGRTAVSLPEDFTGRTFGNIFTGEQIAASSRSGAASISAADALRTLPVALLWSDAEPVAV
jgi:(1->4)-alpha-D-glucan 1-alpha-D-glucosylmutase